MFVAIRLVLKMFLLYPVVESLLFTLDCKFQEL